MSLYGTNNGRQDSLIAALKDKKVDKKGGKYIPPTVDPKVAGAMWNDAGTLVISAG